MMKRTFTLMFALFLTTLQLMAEEEEKQYIFTAINPNYAVSFNGVHAIEVDDNEMLWFGCENGLYYYNSDKFRQYIYSADDVTTPQSNLIYDIFKDSKGQIWVCSSRGLSRYISAEDSFVRIAPEGSIPLSITEIVELHDGSYILTDGANLYNFTDGGEVIFNKIDTGYDQEITSLYVTSGGTLYVGYADGSVACANSSLSAFKMVSRRDVTAVTAICLTQGLLYVGYQESGLDVFDVDGEFIKRYEGDSIVNEFVRDIKVRSCGDVWVGTQRGLFIIYPDGSTQSVEATENNNFHNGSVFEMAVDSHDNVYLGLWGGYITLYNESTNLFIRASQSRVVGTSLTSYFVPRDENSIWVGRERGGLCSYNYKDDSFSTPIYRDLFIKSLTRDSKGDLWIGTFRQGLFKHGKSGNRLQKIDLPEAFEESAIISSVAIDSIRSVVWVGTRFSGVMSYNLKTGDSATYHIRMRGNTDFSRVWDMSICENGDLVVCSDNGISILKLGADSFDTFKYRYDADLNSIYTHCWLDNEQILVGTRYRGIMVFDLNKKSFTNFGWEEDLYDLSIFKLLKDRKGRIWASSNSGIFMCDRFDRDISSYGINEGLICTNLYPNSGVLLDNGVIFFGSNMGFNFMNTNTISTKVIDPQTQIINILVNHQPLSDENCLELDSKHIEDADYIKLSHNNNSLSFKVASGGVSSNGSNSMRFRLIGYQDEWVEMLESKDIVYTKLPFGRYTLEVASSNSRGEWGEPTRLKIEIQAPIYLRWYAWLLYISLFVAVVVIVIREIAFRVRAKRDVAIERHKNALDREASAQRTKFFINVSHELRTPLSLIVTPLNILESESQEPGLNIYIEAIKRNTNRLLRLTNQILDMRLMEVGKISAMPESVDLVDLCQEAHTLFEYQISDKNIRFKFISSANSIYANVDFDMIDKVVCNLLSNALKFIDDGGELTIEIAMRESRDDSNPFDYAVGEQVDGRHIEIVVCDDGAGIPTDRIEHIFDRFVYNNDTSISGSGIGLHMCKEYIALHHGAIRVRSKVDEGSTFSVLIPVTEFTEQSEAPVAVEPYAGLELQLPELNIKLDGEEDSVDAEGSEVVRHGIKPKVLIADDNAEIRLFLKKVLSNQFNCLTANNGEQALDMAKSAKPDLILMDILMPVMNGIESVKALRKSPETQFIPIIMLTGVTDERSVIEAMESGADCHLSKPININLLSAHISRLLTKQSKLTTLINESSVLPTNGGDDLLRLIEAIIEKNVNNPLLDTEYIAKQLNMSRSTLHRRVKSELNIGVNEVIRDYRLRVAVKLMDSANYNVDELAICVGFNSTSYFCKAFKGKYGTSPKRYRDQLKWSNR